MTRFLAEDFLAVLTFPKNTFSVDRSEEFFLRCRVAI
jgi:hypothetical protein